MLKPRLENAAAAAFAALTVVTLIWPSWIESLTGADPDGGDGMAEWVVVVLFAVLSLAAALLARRDYRLAKQRAGHAVSAG
jgi:hypothetical protein